MTSTLAGADIRGFYTALGIILPEWTSGPNVSVRCFVDPDAHAHADRSPSCSINVENGAWKCWSCGASGGAFDAATALGHDDRAAMDLLVAYGLAPRRGRGTSPSSRRRRTSTAAAPPAAATRRQRLLEASEQDVVRWVGALRKRGWPLDMLREEQRDLWQAEILSALQVGWDRGRLTLPIRTCAGELQGVLRYAPRPTRGPKMLAMPGTRLGLLPHPERAAEDWNLLCEGGPDMLSARSRGLPAIGVPGDHAWEPDWAESFAGRHVAVLMDCDRAGRAAVERILGDLADAGVSAVGVEIAAHRDDGYDLTDWLHAHRELSISTLHELFIP
jgi:DNA primase